MSGEAFTTRLKITLDLLSQFLGTDLESINLGMGQAVQEVGPAESRDLGRFAL
jgi:hypothetical protein